MTAIIEAQALGKPYGSPAPPGGGRHGGHWAGVDPSALLLSPQFWIGLALAALMVWAAIALRRRAAEA